MEQKIGLSMVKVVGEKRKKATIEIDGKHFIDCEFIDCKFRYRGLGLVRFQRGFAIGCTFDFNDDSMVVIEALRRLVAKHGTYRLWMLMDGIQNMDDKLVSEFINDDPWGGHFSTPEAIRVLHFLANARAAKAFDYVAGTVDLFKGKNAAPIPDLDGPVYIYLGQKGHVENWVKGGRIPLRLASSYRSKERFAGKTPDENVTYTATHPETLFQNLVELGYFMTDVGFENVWIDEKHYPRIHIAERSYSDGPVLCTSRILSNYIAYRFEKRKFCVRVDDFPSLKAHIDGQLGAGEIGNCEYTAGHNRSPFLKSIWDAWQFERRALWQGNAEVWVDIPRGTGRPVPITPVERMSVQEVKRLGFLHAEAISAVI